MAGFRGGTCNRATARPELEDGLRSGDPLPDVVRRSGVRTKLGVNMAILGEPDISRLSKEVRFGPGEKSSSQKCPPQFSSGTAPMSGKLTSCPVNLTKPSSYFGYNFSS